MVAAIGRRQLDVALGAELGELVTVLAVQPVQIGILLQHLQTDLVALIQRVPGRKGETVGLTIDGRFRAISCLSMSGLVIEL